MAADRGEQHLPETADDEGDGVDRQEIGRPMHQVVPQAGRIEAGEQRDQGKPPVVLRGQQFRLGRKCAVGLETDVPHAEEHGRKSAEPDGDHHPLEVQAVAYVGGGPGDAGWLVETGIDRLVEGIPFFVAAALVKMMLDAVEPGTQPHAQPSFSMRVRLSRRMGPYSYLPAQT
ncbi:hypothetical protein SDC9_168687 [bioreactor metagenome]|uniref:Uncharacterized protein n=1 Tax=bioreactor metagenome TaxID=1076179 RepID=A0A645G370_9ZZZZ